MEGYFFSGGVGAPGVPFEGVKVGGSPKPLNMKDGDSNAGNFYNAAMLPRLRAPHGGLKNDNGQLDNTNKECGADKINFN